MKTIMLEVNVIIEVEVAEGEEFLETLAETMSKFGEGVIQVSRLDGNESRQTHAAPTTVQ